jgi:putative protease
VSEGHIKLPELLAPAGDWECAKAAVENGADAIYFGLDRFNARMRAANFTEADLPRLMAFLHRRGVRGYLSFNTLVFTEELAEAEQFLRASIAAGVDAAIVQDVGICRLIRRLSPDFPIHASTQMTITSAAGVEFARELGCQLVVLARECSLKEIALLQSAPGDTSSPHHTLTSRLPLEVFVHGALCVAYSGQCLTSESLGGRSANRGECAQACRLPYELIADGQPVPLDNRRYLLSPQDLAGLELVPELARLGVASLKIEGRLKSPEYVANITRIYRQAIDKLADRQCEETHAPDREIQHQPARIDDHSDQYKMEMAFSRGLFTGWLRGVNNQALVHGRFGKKRGVFLGEVAEVRRDSVVVGLAAPLKPGDGVVFDAGRPEEAEEGGRVYEIRSLKSSASTSAAVELRFGRDDIHFGRVHAGDKLWKTSDPELDRRLRQSFAGDTPRFQRPIDMEVRGTVGTPLELTARDELGNMVTLESAMALMAATNRPLTTERLREQLGRLGGTPFTQGSLTNRLTGEVLLPVSELNRLRRKAVAQMETLRSQPKRWTLNENATVRPPSKGLSTAAQPELIVLVRDLTQLDAALQCGVRTVYCEFEDPKKYREAVVHFRAAQVDSQPSTPAFHPTIWVAPPRVTKPGEEWILKQVQSCGADGYLLRNFDHLKYFAGARCVGDYSLNVANPLTAEYFLKRFSLERLTASYDLNNAQLEALLMGAPPAWFEITIHQHMPMFHMEHCVFCAFLSNGKNYTNCGRPCDHRTVRLRDRVGAEHPVKADAGCRNTVFNALAQTGAEYVARLLALGARHFRVEFLDEPPGVVARTIGMYQRLLRGEIAGAELWRDLKLRHQLGVTRGSLDKGSRPVTVL